jgi:hypothetical protein
MRMAPVQIFDVRGKLVYGGVVPSHEFGVQLK